MIIVNYMNLAQVKAGDFNAEYFRDHTASVHLTSRVEVIAAKTGHASTVEAGTAASESMVAKTGVRLPRVGRRLSMIASWKLNWLSFRPVQFMSIPFYPILLNVIV